MSGFSFLEAIVALAILGIVITSMVTILSRHSFLDRHLDGHLEALRSIEAQAEAMRGGMQFPVDDGTHELVPVLAPGEPVENFALRAKVLRLGPGRFYSVTFVATYRVGRAEFSRTLETRLWRP